MVERYDYGHFGQPEFYNAAGTPLTGTAYGNPYLFTGRRFDPESGFYYYRARYYDPRVGQFTTRDPIGVWGDPLNMGNGYAYVGNNPWTLVDPIGWYGTNPCAFDDGMAAASLLKGLWNSIPEKWQYRTTGSLGLVGAGFEVFGGASLALGTAPTVAGPVLGTFIVLHGLDSAWACVRQVYCGKQTYTLTNDLITALTNSPTAGN